ncbi:MAG: cytochrome c oxidase subunit II [Pseudonocardiales bacterium]|nr:cytochrome c oxidase subunit II [Pseudonocardiales bacterium]
MATTEAPPREEAGRREPKHGLRIFLIWLPVALAADLIIWFVWGPHMVPGAMADQAKGQQFDINVMAIMAAPVMAFVLIYAGYALVVWRHRAGDDEDGPPIHGNTRVSVAWIGLTSAIVLGLFVFGTYELVVPAGAGGGEGNTPIWQPSGAAPLQVQVIGQQWRWTYRYPQFGGFETTDLVLPVGREIQFNVTSLDVIHSFAAYQLGVKADANPGVNNVAYVKALQTGHFNVRCFELCGLWHADMTTVGHVVSVQAFRAWADTTRVRLANLTRILPPFALVYNPNSVAQLGKAFRQAGLSGAGGNYYGPQYQVQP